MNHCADYLTAARERFATKSWIRTESGCWEWNGTLHRESRYGVLNIQGEQRRAHRVAWELANGRLIPDGLVVRHDCDNPPCVNPDHLRLGTHADNVADRCRRGRGATGELAPRALYTSSEVLAMRVLWDHGLADQPRLASIFGGDQANLSKIVCRKTWKHLPDLGCPDRCGHAGALALELKRHSLAVQSLIEADQQEPA